VTTTGTTVWTIDLPGITHDFKVSRVELSLDELNTVYVHADITVAPFPDSVDADLRAAIIDGTQRITITADREILTPTPDTQTRTFDLVLHERSIDEAGDIVFQCASDEALLEVRGLVAAAPLDRGFLPAATAPVQSARDIIDAILDDYLGAALEPGTVDADITRTLELSNMIRNPGFETNIADWVASSNASGLVRATLRKNTGAASMRWTATANGNSSVKMTSLPYDPSRAYQLTAMLSAQVARDMKVLLRIVDEDGAEVWTASGTVISAPTSGFAQSLTQMPKPPTIGNLSSKPGVKLEVFAQALAAAAGNQFYIDDVMLFAIPEEVAEIPNLYTGFPVYDMDNYFDGSGSPTDSSSYYTYAWDGPTNNSSSKRIPNDTRGLQLLCQQPGQTYRAYLDPLVDLAEGRLFCDELRQWWLVDDTYTPAGTITLTDAESIAHWKDTVSLTESFDGLPTTFTGVVVIYETVARPKGTVDRQYDFAGDDSGRVYRKVVQGAYPGPGAAAALLARAAGRQRSIPVTATTDLTATPSMALTMTIAGTDYTGYASKVVWEWSDTRDQMTITPRDLIEA
jgi:hypothetical protein